MHPRHLQIRLVPIHWPDIFRIPRTLHLRNQLHRKAKPLQAPLQPPSHLPILARVADEGIVFVAFSSISNSAFLLKNPSGIEIKPADEVSTDALDIIGVNSLVEAGHCATLQNHQAPESCYCSYSHLEEQLIYPYGHLPLLTLLFFLPACPD